MIEKEKNAIVISLAQADFDIIRHLEQGMEVTQLAQPGEQVVVEMLVALGADIDGLAQTEGVHGHRRAAVVKVFGIGGQDLAVLRFDEIAPKFGWMQVTCRESALEGQMILLTRGQLVELQNFEAE